MDFTSTQNHAIGKKTQNNGVMVKGDDTNVDKEYYGMLDHIYELSSDVYDEIERVETLLNKLQLVKRERAQVLKDLKEKVSFWQSFREVTMLMTRAIDS